MKRVLGLDVGDKRIGIAISDELRITTRGLLTLDRTNIKNDIQKISDIASENECSAVILGLPLNVSGEDSKQTEKIRMFAVKLENKFLSFPKEERIEIYFQDERFSTQIAEQLLDEIGVKKPKKRKIIDQEAACVILEDWLSEN